MQIILSSAKIMHSFSLKAPVSQPLFDNLANQFADEMAQMEVEELMKQLDCGRKIAAENLLRFRNFSMADKMPALFAYNGQAYKHLRAKELSDDALAFAQEHLWITTFMYGLLRPMDAIAPYRMEHCVTLESTDDRPVNRFWRDKLTDLLIDSVRADDGVLVHLSTEEYEHLFDWQRVRREVTVIQPMFYVRRGDELRMQAVWAKSCRGAMTRYILNNRLLLPEELCGFCYKGFEYDPKVGESAFPHFIRVDY